jgi:hypothetical protein
MVPNALSGRLGVIGKISGDDTREISHLEKEILAAVS